MPTRTANAIWNGDLPNGSGTMKLNSGAYEGAYSFKSRFKDGEGTNPEELIGAALSGCYSMALSNELAEAGFDPKSVETEAAVTLGDSAITTIKLTVKADIADIDNDTFQEYAQGAKEGCPVSNALAGVDNIKLDATLT